MNGKTIMHTQSSRSERGNKPAKDKWKKAREMRGKKTKTKEKHRISVHGKCCQLLERLQLSGSPLMSGSKKTKSSVMTWG